jgi:sugar phosphate isomerase/epimerase
VDGIEFWGKGLAGKVRDIVAAMQSVDGMVAASVNHGRQSRFLDPDPAERERALAELRDSICCARDIGAKGVIFVPHFGDPTLPDLTPWLSASEVEAEMLHTHLRTLSDFAQALGVELYVEPINRYETHFLNRLNQAARVARRINHPRVKIVADLFHMALEEANIADAIRAHADVIGHVHLADHNRRLPGQGWIDFAAAAAALREIGYTGWAAFECGDPSANEPRAAAYTREFPASLAMLRAAGWND